MFCVIRLMVWLYFITFQCFIGCESLGVCCVFSLDLGKTYNIINNYISFSGCRCQPKYYLFYAIIYSLHKVSVKCHPL